jgi:hypothetical protein
MGTATDHSRRDRALHAICVWPPGRVVVGGDGWNQWAGAVVASARGDYGTGWQQFSQLRHEADPELVGMAAAAQGSILRQLGDHKQAISYDRIAVETGGIAALDGLTGLAADHIFDTRPGSDRDWLQEARRELMDRINQDSLDRVVQLRAELRFSWVAAEMDLASDRPTTALNWAETGLQVAEQLASPRHQLKTQLIHAVAGECAGGDRSAELQSVLATATEFRLDTLVWPAAAALGDRLADDYRGVVARALTHISAHRPNGVGDVWAQNVPGD